MGQGLEQPAPRTHPLAVGTFLLFLRVAMGFLDVAIGDSCVAQKTILMLRLYFPPNVATCEF